MSILRAIRQIVLVTVMGTATTCTCAEELVVFSGEAFQPEIYKENGKALGIIPAILERLSKDTGDTYTLVLLPWKRALAESTAGHGGITSFSWTEDRALIFDYSDPLLDNPIQLTILKTRVNEFKTFGDLNGKVIGLPLGTKFGGAFEKAVADKVIFVDEDTSPVSRLRKLLVGRIDLAAIGANGVKAYVSSDSVLAENMDKFATAPFILTNDILYLAFPKSMHKEAALQRFNKALAALRKNHEYQKIVSQYIAD